MHMRIISGSLGGRQFNSPSGHRTHPMSDKIRGALFNMLGDIKGLAVLDAFAGSGAVGFEAISRGATHATLLELDTSAHDTIKQNIELLDLEDTVQAVRVNARSWSNRYPNEQFDLIICDPPYDRVQHDTVEKLAHHLRPGGTFVLSWPSIQDLPRLPQFTQVATRRYGNANLVFYKNNGPQQAG